MTGSRFIILGGGMSGYATKQQVELGLNPGQLAIMSADTSIPYEGHLAATRRVVERSTRNFQRVHPGIGAYDA